MSVLNMAMSKKIGVVIGTYMINRKETFELYGPEMKRELERNTYYLKYAYLMKHYKELALLQPIKVYKIRPPIEKFSMVAPSASFEVGSPDIDGTIRTLPLFVEEVWANETGKLSGFLPHMDVLGAAFYLGEDPKKPLLEVDFKRRVVEIKNHEIPFDSYGLFHVNYYGKGPKIFKTVSFVDVYKDNVDLNLFKDKVVLIGYTATAKGLYDLRKTPFSNNEPGIYIHATAVENMIRGDTILRLTLLEKIALILVSILFSAAFLNKERIIINTVSFSFVPLIMLIGYYMFLKGIYLDIFYPIFSSATLGAYGIAFNSYKSIQERKRFREYLYRYLDSSVAEQIVKSGKKELENERKAVVVLFSDIRGFTTLSEKMDPQDVVNLLNVYFERMSTVIKENGGMIDKFIGDAIMAIFGVPLEREDDVIRALRSAIGMRRELEKLREELGISLDNGIGLHYGEVIV
jgi:adenylate cyclase